MALTDVDICNRALARTGQQQFITSTDPAVDGTPQAKLCSVLYAAARDALLGRFPWSFATQWDTLTSMGAGAERGWAYKYQLPAACISPLAIMAGYRPGQVITPERCYPFGPPAVRGAADPIGFEVVNGLIYTDAKVPALYDGTKTYKAGDIVRFVNLAPADDHFWVSQADGNLGHAPYSSPAYWAQADQQPVFVYVYAAAPALFSPTFAEALSWRLASDLALSLATKDGLANAFDAQAERALARAMAADGNGRKTGPRPDSIFITGRR